jgi:hypothetical protein
MGWALSAVQSPLFINNVLRAVLTPRCSNSDGQLACRGYLAGVTYIAFPDPAATAYRSVGAPMDFFIPIRDYFSESLTAMLTSVFCSISPSRSVYVVVTYPISAICFLQKPCAG